MILSWKSYLRLSDHSFCDSINKQHSTKWSIVIRIIQLDFPQQSIDVEKSKNPQLKLESCKLKINMVQRHEMLIVDSYRYYQKLRITQQQDPEEKKLSLAESYFKIYTSSREIRQKLARLQSIKKSRQRSSSLLSFHCGFRNCLPCTKIFNRHWKLNSSIENLIKNSKLFSASLSFSCFV